MLIAIMIMQVILCIGAALMVLDKVACNLYLASLWLLEIAFYNDNELLSINH